MRAPRTHHGRRPFHRRRRIRATIGIAAPRSNRRDPKVSDLKGRPNHDAHSPSAAARRRGHINRTAEAHYIARCAPGEPPDNGVDGIDGIVGIVGIDMVLFDGSASSRARVSE